MQIITRAEWDARPPRSRFAIATPTPKLYLHHAAGAVLPGDNTVSDTDLRRIRSIQNYHMDVRGWSDIAYSFLMDPDGNIFEGRGAGIAGGHTAGQNTVSHAICIMGNYDTQAVDTDLVPRLAAFVQFGHEQGWWPAQFTGGHRDAPGASTSCPGRNLYADLDEINQQATQEVDMADIPSAWLNTLEALHEAFDGSTLPTRLDQLDRLVDDIRKDLITKDELNAAIQAALAQANGAGNCAAGTQANQTLSKIKAVIP